MSIYKKSPYKQLEFSEMPKYVKMPPPTWETAMSIYVEVLKNPNATEKGKQIAVEDLMNLARTVDRCNLVEREAA